MSDSPTRKPPKPGDAGGPQEDKPTLVTKEGVQVFVREPPTPPWMQQRKPEPPPVFEPLVPDAIIIPGNVSFEDREAFLAYVDEKFGRFIDKEVSRHRDVAPASVEDVHQTVLLTLSKHYDKQRKAEQPVLPEKMEAFLRTVVENAVKNHGRKKKRRVVIEDGAEIEEAVTSAPDPEMASMLSEYRDKIRGYRARLSVLERAVYEAREEDPNMTFEEIGKKLQLTDSTVFNAYKRAVGKLEEMIIASQRRAALRTPRADSQK